VFLPRVHDLLGNTEIIGLPVVYVLESRVNLAFPRLVELVCVQVQRVTLQEER